MLKICRNCGKEFDGKAKQICCSRKCSNEMKYPKIKVKCDICGKEVIKTKTELNRNKHAYCSIECRNKGYSKYQTGDNNPNYKNANTIVTCSNCNKEFKILNCNMKNSDGSLKKNFYCCKECKAEHQKTLLKGENNPKYKGGQIEKICSFCGKKKMVERNHYNKNNKHYYCSLKCKAEHQKTLLLKENNPNYIEGLSEDYRIRYRIIEGYNTWRRKVYEKDNYTCQCCGDDKGGNLNAHHLEGYNSNKDKRIDVNNGITLCEKCHKKFHDKYGRGNNTKKQFEEFLTLYIDPVVK